MSRPDRKPFFPHPPVLAQLRAELAQGRDPFLRDDLHAAPHSERWSLVLDHACACAEALGCAIEIYPDSIYVFRPGE